MPQNCNWSARSRKGAYPRALLPRFFRLESLHSQKLIQRLLGGMSLLLLQSGTATETNFASAKSEKSKPPVVSVSKSSIADKSTKTQMNKQTQSPSALSLSEKVVDILIEAEEFFSEGRYTRASEKYKELIVIAPKNPEGYIGLGRIFLITGKDQEAVTKLRKAVELSPGSADAHFELGSVYLALGQLDEAIDELSIALDLSPNRPEIKYKLSQAKTLQDATRIIPANNSRLAVSSLTAKTTGPIASEVRVIFRLITSGRVEEAIEQGELALVNDQENSRLNYQLGLLYRAVGDLNQAIEAFEKSLEADPEHAHSLSQLFSLYLSLKNKDSALETASKWVKVDSDNPEAHFALAWCHILNSAFEQALPPLRSAVQLDPRNPDLLNHLGLVHRELGNRKEAERTLLRALPLSADTTSPRLNLAMIYLSENRIENAHDVLKPLNESNPVPPNILAMTALIEAKKNDTVSAREKIDRVLKVDPDNSVALVALAEIYSASGNDSHAAQLLEGAHKKHPENVFVMARLSMHELANGNTDRAVELSKRAFELSPHIYPVTRAHTLVLARIGQKDSALEIIDAIPEKFKSDLRFNTLRGEILESTGAYKEAADYFKALVAKNPDDINLKVKLASCYLSAKDYRSARAILEPLIDQDASKDDEALRLLVRTLFESKNYRESLALAKKVSAPTSELILFIARSQFRLKLWNESIDSFKTVMESTDLQEGDLVSLSDALRRVKRPDEAKAVLVKARRYEPQTKLVKAAIKQLERSCD